MSPSADEVAFAEALAQHGIVFEERASNSMIGIRFYREQKRVHTKSVTSKFKHQNNSNRNSDTNNMQQSSMPSLDEMRNSSILKRYEVMGLLDFTAARKRMTVIVKIIKSKNKNKNKNKNNKNNQGSSSGVEYILYCKGADSTILDMCDTNNKKQNQIIEITKDHLMQFAKQGSRTLCMAFKKLCYVMLCVCMRVCVYLFEKKWFWGCFVLVFFCVLFFYCEKCVCK